MTRPVKIWVLPELNTRSNEISTLSLGLLSEARAIADKTGGTVTALVPGDQTQDYSDLFNTYGVNSAYLFINPLLQFYSADAYFEILSGEIRKRKPWMFLMGNTLAGKELSARLAILMETGLVSNCVKMDLSNPAKPVFYRPVYEGQLYQEIVFPQKKTMLVTMAPEVLNIAPVKEKTKVEISVLKPRLSSDTVRVKHEEFLPVDYKNIDVTDADVIVSVGMGTVISDTVMLAQELAGLIGGTIGTTRPVVDEGVLSKDRMIGQTGKIVKPGFYLAMGISGSTHHIGGMKDSGTIVSINSDPDAPIFQNSNIGIISDIKGILPKLIEKIKQEKENGTIL